VRKSEEYLTTGHEYWRNVAALDFSVRASDMRGRCGARKELKTEEEEHHHEGGS
jgi:hypothetical protein